MFCLYNAYKAAAKMGPEEFIIALLAGIIITPVLFWLVKKIMELIGK